MAEGTIRIVPDKPDTNGGEAKQSDEFTIISAEQFAATDSANNRTPRVSAKDRRREKRAALRVENRGNESSEVKTDGAEPEKKTPVPKSRVKTEVRHYMTDTQALTNAKFYLSALEMMAVSIAGRNGEMSEFERAMMTPALKRTLTRIPLEALEKGNVVLDSMFLVGGMTMYMNRVTGGVSWKWPWKRSQRKGEQNDPHAPVSQPMETVVPTTRTGDIDGLAIPVPPIFNQYMNGSI